MSFFGWLFGGYGWNHGLSEFRCLGHEGWLSRYRIGPGRLVVKDEKLTGTRVYSRKLSYARFERCDLSRMQLSWAHFEHAELIDCKLEDGQLEGATFDGATIEECSFDRSVVHNADFIGATLRRSSLAQAGLIISRWESAKVDKVSFQGSHVRNARLTGASFVDCDFRDADLRRDEPGNWAARFERCDLRGAKLEGHQFAEAVFVDCKLDGPLGGYR